MSQTNILLETGTNELEIVEFHIDEEGYRGHYGLNVAKVVEIIRDLPVTSMPQMRHPCVKGAFAYRNGRIVPLIDLSTYLGVTEHGATEAKIIITEFNTVLTGFRVSGVNRIYRLSWTDVESPDKFLQSMKQVAITGVVRLDGRVVFILDLEAIVADLHPAMAIRMDEPKENEVAPDRKARVLHADDSSSIRKIILSMLDRSQKFEVFQVNDGQEAWNYLLDLKKQAESAKKPITHFLDGIITDIEMPYLDGLTLCRRIKEDPVLKPLPVAVFSSLINDSVALKARSVGADGEFTKPDLQGLSQKMLELIAARSA